MTKEEVRQGIKLVIKETIGTLLIIGLIFGGATCILGGC